jgi:S-formylglutathione hydrolase FrmB
VVRPARGLQKGRAAMALFHAHFFSDALQVQCAADVIQPDRRQDPGRPLPCLWLLHGLSDDHTIWQRRTSIERHVTAYDLAVVMPCVHRSFYADMAYGPRYWTFVSDELPRLMRQYFPLSERRDGNFVAGLSMGGYGAFKLAFNLPERYAAAASLSGAMDMAARLGRGDIGPDMRLVFGDRPLAVSDDLLAAAEALARSSSPRPRLFQCCGTEDYLYPENVRFRDHARRLGLDLVYAEGPGSHEWGYWDARIQDVLAWLGLPRR